MIVEISQTARLGRNMDFLANAWEGAARDTGGLWVMHSNFAIGWRGSHGGLLSGRFNFNEERHIVVFSIGVVIVISV
jgi:hypothetical protein